MTGARRQPSRRSQPYEKQGFSSGTADLRPSSGFSRIRLTGPCRRYRVTCQTNRHNAPFACTPSKRVEASPSLSTWNQPRMKSHPDAASRSAAEVVTQLPVPSRLGLLRFERLNEPSWALLFLDPACERQLGLPATTLCALLDAPYASLMEPEARHRLHEQIQQQLVKRPHYQVSYKLHTPNGVLTMLEFGEAFQQHGRQLLHGYLMVEERAESAERSEQLLDLESQNLRLKASLTSTSAPGRPPATPAALAHPAEPDRPPGPPSLPVQRPAAGSRATDHPGRLRSLRHRARRHLAAARRPAPGSGDRLPPRPRPVREAPEHRRQPLPRLPRGGTQRARHRCPQRPARPTHPGTLQGLPEAAGSQRPARRHHPHRRRGGRRAVPGTRRREPHVAERRDRLRRGTRRPVRAGPDEPRATQCLQRPALVPARGGTERQRLPADRPRRRGGIRQSELHLDHPVQRRRSA